MTKLAIWSNKGRAVGKLADSPSFYRAGKSGAKVGIGSDISIR